MIEPRFVPADVPPRDQGRADCGFQSVLAHGFCKTGGHSRRQQPLPLGLQAVRRRADDRCTRRRSGESADRLRGLLTVHDRHHYVHHDEVETLAPYCLDRSCAVLHRSDVASQLGEQALHYIAVAFRVFGQEDAGSIGYALRGSWGLHGGRVLCEHWIFAVVCCRFLDQARGQLAKLLRRLAGNRKILRAIFADVCLQKLQPASERRERRSDGVRHFRNEAIARVQRIFDLGLCRGQFQLQRRKLAHASLGPQLQRAHAALVAPFLGNIAHHCDDVRRAFLGARLALDRPAEPACFAIVLPYDAMFVAMGDTRRSISKELDAFAHDPVAVERMDRLDKLLERRLLAFGGTEDRSSTVRDGKAPVTFAVSGRHLRIRQRAEEKRAFDFQLPCEIVFAQAQFLVGPVQFLHTAFEGGLGIAQGPFAAIEPGSEDLHHAFCRDVVSFIHRRPRRADLEACRASPPRSRTTHRHVSLPRRFRPL